jgi:hypothetical protein
MNAIRSKDDGNMYSRFLIYRETCQVKGPSRSGARKSDAPALKSSAWCGSRAGDMCIEELYELVEESVLKGVRIMK